MGGKANESDALIITNTPKETTSFPGCALLWKSIGERFDFLSAVSQNSQAKETQKPREEKLMGVMSIL